MKVNEIYNVDCTLGINELINSKQYVDLIVTDPPYLIKCTNGGYKSNLSKRVRKYNKELLDCNLTCGISTDTFKLLWDCMKKPNFYFFCNRNQIQQYLDFFVNKNKCTWEMLVWNKTNVPPFYSNKYLCDKEYIMHFRKGALCHPPTYQKAKTVFYGSTNKKRQSSIWPSDY